jgi:hypothetical protein
MSFQASYDGDCPECPEDILEGDEVEYYDDVLMHVECAREAKEEAGEYKAGWNPKGG